MITTRIISELNRELERCCSPVRHARIIRRWARTEPDLALYTIAEILELAAVATPAQNPPLRSLLRLHQAGDPDAGTVLMATVTPMLKRIASIRKPHGLSHVTAAELDNLWGAFAHLIATIDPAVELRPEPSKEERPMLAYLGPRVGTSHDILDPDERRHRRCNRQRREIALQANDSHIDDRSVLFMDHKANVADTALASIELGRIVEVFHSGKISDTRWRALIEHRLDRTPPPQGSSAVGRRLRAMRAAQQLSELVGHAA
jgi:hypothetical protein